ncbi:MAG: toxic anion resistance protein [Verrucomicrobiae bacterium]|nr:toxic anion resistance protein [Verrucomicrobiae bacterium]
MSDTSPTQTSTTEPLEIVQELPASLVARESELKSPAFTEPQLRQIEELKKKLDLNDNQSIISFGVESQRKVTAQAEQMIENVKNKDGGPAGEALNELVTHVRGLSPEKMDGGNIFERLFYRFMNPLAKFIQRYETASRQIDTIVKRLEKHKMTMFRDITMLDKLYEASFDQFMDLKLYIAAAEQVKEDWTRNLIPALETKAKAGGDVLDAQKLRDAIARRDDLDRKIGDLRLTHTATLQSLPQIRMVQDVDKSLINKIQTSILTTIPIWKNQMALAITLFNQKKAIETQRKVSDATNEMLRKNSELLRTNNAEGRREIERGVIDMETLKKVNDDLLAGLQETLQITEDAKSKRIEAAREMLQLESSLKEALSKSESVRTV